MPKMLQNADKHHVELWIKTCCFAEGLVRSNFQVKSWCSEVWWVVDVRFICHILKKSNGSLHPTIWPDKAKLAMPVDMAAVKQQCSTGAFDAQQLDSAASWKDNTGTWGRLNFWKSIHIRVFHDWEYHRCGKPGPSTLDRIWVCGLGMWTTVHFGWYVLLPHRHFSLLILPVIFPNNEIILSGFARQLRVRRLHGGNEMPSSIPVGCMAEFWKLMIYMNNWCLISSQPAQSF